MTLEEIELERKKLMSLEDFDYDNWKRLDELKLEKERILKRIHFHFEEDLSVSQIQLFAKVFKCFINGPYVLEERHLVQLVYPKECSNANELRKMAKIAEFVGLFFISTPRYGSLEYTTKYQKQIPDMWISIDLLSLQNNYQEIRDLSKQEDKYAIVDSMITSYTLSNSSIGHHLFFGDYNLGGYRFGDKVAPNITYVDVLRNLRSTISLSCNNKEDKNWAVYAKYKILDFAYQCRYLSFWSCLIDVMSFPGISDEESTVLNNVAGWFLSNLTNPYVYHLSCESNPLNEDTDYSQRESSDNTSRIKVYLTKTDDKPMLVRFDLPHKGEPYVHLNIEQEGKNEHFRLSTDVVDNSFDHVFDNLCESLTSFNFNGSFFYHSPVCKDREIIRRMPEYTAMMNLSSYMEGISMGLTFEELPASIENALNSAVDTIIEIVSTEFGDISSMSLPELYLYSDMILDRELKET